MVSATPESLPASDGKPTFWDVCFILLLCLAVVGVVWVGHLAYKEGVKTELTKRHGEAWLEWLNKANGVRGDAGFEPQACARAEGRTWGPCLAWLVSAEGPMAAHVNAFTGEPQKLGLKCDMDDRGLVGALVLERLKPTPPGSAVPVVVEALADTDPIKDVLSLRVTVCDKGAGPIKIGETEF
ncbi:MAG: hypothetical protein RIT26_2414 [Pseudomonadota bacterium]